MQWPVFEEADTDSAMKSLTHDQSQRASKHLYTNDIQTTGYKKTGESFEQDFEKENGGDDDKWGGSHGDGIDNIVESPRVEDERIYDERKGREERLESVQEYRVKVLFDFDTEEDDEIALREGMVLTQIGVKDEQGWCEGRLDNGQTGLFPGNYVEML